MAKRFVLVAVLLSGCAAPLTYAKARELGCGEACAAFAYRRGDASSTAWPLEPGMCGCRMDDGTIHMVSERPKEDLDTKPSLS